MRVLVLLVVVAALACAAPASAAERTVGYYQKHATCSTTVVAGLTQQLVQQMECMSPGTMASIKDMKHVDLSAAAKVVPYLQKPVADALKKATEHAKANGRTIRINSALRSLPQQLLLHSWWKAGKCGYQVVAAPGRSNHNGGLAIDVSNTAQYRAALRAAGFKWYGSGDLPHYTYTGNDGKDIRELSVRAFQKLWNANHPDAPIEEDGKYGEEVAGALSRTPAKGFARGASCAAGGALKERTDLSDPRPVPDSDETVATQVLVQGQHMEAWFLASAGVETIALSVPYAGKWWALGEPLTRGADTAAGVRHVLSPDTPDVRRFGATLVHNPRQFGVVSYDFSTQGERVIRVQGVDASGALVFRKLINIEVGTPVVSLAVPIEAPAHVMMFTMFTPADVRDAVSRVEYSALHNGYYYSIGVAMSGEQAFLNEYEFAVGGERLLKAVAIGTNGEVVGVAYRSTVVEGPLCRWDMSTRQANPASFAVDCADSDVSFVTYASEWKGQWYPMSERVGAETGAGFPIVYGFEHVGERRVRADCFDRNGAQLYSLETTVHVSEPNSN